MENDLLEKSPGIRFCSFCGKPDCLSFWSPTLHENTIIMKKQQKSTSDIALNFDLLDFALFIHGKFAVFPMHVLPFFLKVVLENPCSSNSQVITLSKNSGFLQLVLKYHRKSLLLVRSFGTICAQTIVICKLACSVCHTVLWSMNILFCISRILSR